MGGEMVTVSWETSHAAPPAQLDEKKKHLLPLIRFGVAALPEAKVMQLTFLGGTALGLSTEKAGDLHSLLSKRYREIEADKTFAAAPSALPYCYSATKPETGLASVFRPEIATAKTEVIVFLHGYGGSFAFYQHYLASAFPDRIIVFPAYGISCARIPGAYIQECLDATKKKLGFPLKKPVLMGLSAGGYGGFREYARKPDRYAGYICLAAYPPKEVVPRSPRAGRIRLLAGGNESFVKNNALGFAELSLKRRTPDYQSHLIPDEDHFFMLSSEEETKQLLKRWVEELQGGGKTRSDDETLRSCLRFICRGPRILCVFVATRGHHYGSVP